MHGRKQVGGVLYLTCLFPCYPQVWMSVHLTQNVISGGASVNVGEEEKGEHMD